MIDQRKTTNNLSLSQKIAIVLLVVNCGSVYGISFSLFFYFCLLVCVVISFIHFEINKSLLSSAFYCIIVFSIAIWINYYLAEDCELISMVSLNFRFILASLICIRFWNCWKSFFTYLSKIIFLLICISIVTWILSQYLTMTQSTIGNETLLSWNGLIFVRNEVSILGLSFFRNQFFFWEPGFYALIIVLYIFAQLFEQKINVKRITIAFFVLLTTVSTTGIFIVLLPMLHCMFLRSNKNNMLKFLIVLTCLVFGIIAFYSLDSKINRGGRSSYALRKRDLIIPYHMLPNHIWKGYGHAPTGSQIDLLNDYVFLYFTKEDDLFFYNDEEGGSSNGVLWTMVTWGVIWSVLFFYLFYKQVVFKDNRLLFFIVIIFLLSSSSVFTFILILLFPVSGLVSMLGAPPCIYGIEEETQTDRDGLKEAL